MHTDIIPFGYSILLSRFRVRVFTRGYINGSPFGLGRADVDVDLTPDYGPL